MSIETRLAEHEEFITLMPCLDPLWMWQITRVSRRVVSERQHWAALEAKCRKCGKEAVFERLLLLPYASTELIG